MDGDAGTRIMPTPIRWLEITLQEYGNSIKGECGHCGSSLDPKIGRGIDKRQVFDLPERPLMVTEHQSLI